MAFGDSPDDESLRNAWQKFCHRLQEAGERVFKDYNPATPLHRADAFRFLTQNLGQAFDLALETKDTKYPVLHPFCTPHRKLGGDAADFIYLQAWIDGESVYKISGNRGTARFLNFTVQGPRPEKQPGHGYAESARAVRRHSRRRISSGHQLEASRTAASSCTSAGRVEDRTGCRRRRARANFSCARASIAGTNCPRA